MSEDARKEAPKEKVKAVTLRAKYKSATLDEFIDQYARYISRSGIFIKSPKPPEIGTLLKLDLQLATGATVLSAVGYVVQRCTDADATAENPAGMGIRFLKVDDGSQSVIEKIVALKGEDAGPHFPSLSSRPSKPAPAPEATAPVEPQGGFFGANTPTAKDLPPEQDRTQMRQMNALLGEALRLARDSPAFTAEPEPTPTPAPAPAPASTPASSGSHPPPLPAQKGTIVGMAPMKSHARVEPAGAPGGALLPTPTSESTTDALASLLKPPQAAADSPRLRGSTPPPLPRSGTPAGTPVSTPAAAPVAAPIEAPAPTPAPEAPDSLTAATDNSPTQVTSKEQLESLLRASLEPGAAEAPEGAPGDAPAPAAVASPEPPKAPDAPVAPAEIAAAPPVEPAAPMTLEGLAPAAPSAPPAPEPAAAAPAEKAPEVAPEKPAAEAPEAEKPAPAAEVTAPVEAVPAPTKEPPKAKPAPIEVVSTPPDKVYVSTTTPPKTPEPTGSGGYLGYILAGGLALALGGFYLATRDDPNATAPQEQPTEAAPTPPAPPATPTPPPESAPPTPPTPDPVVQPTLQPPTVPDPGQLPSAQPTPTPTPAPTTAPEPAPTPTPPTAAPPTPPPAPTPTPAPTTTPEPAPAPVAAAPERPGRRPRWRRPPTGTPTATPTGTPTGTPTPPRPAPDPALPPNPFNE
ncbi:MAG: PilZ domain-containing protein [Deltaproteobacteria bacterium]|nr:PilZ domain-containing protein [Deltaproteobacteria bacterium]